MKIVFYIILFVSVVFGQNETANIKQAESLFIVPEQPGNNAASVLSGNLKQIIPGSIYNNVNSLNISNSMQLGNNNYLSLIQAGESINSIIMQKGNGNNYEGTLQGNDINNYILQNGNMQYINQTVTGNRLEYSIIQEGINNKIFQYDNNSSINNYSIRQTGINMQLIIVNGMHR